MNDMTSSTSKQRLEELKTEISTWRSQKKSPQQKVPEEIWAKLAKIAPYFNLKTLVETLKLDAKLIRNRNLPVGSQISPAAKTDTTTPAKAEKTASAQKTSTGATGTAKKGSKTTNGKSPVKSSVGTQKNQQQTNKTPAKKKSVPQPVSQTKPSSNVKSTKPQSSPSLSVKADAEINQQRNKPAATGQTKAQVKQDNLYPIELKMPNGATMTVRLPWEELLLFVNQATK